MRWNSLFADLDARAAALENAERAAEIEDRTRGEAAAVGLADRFRAGVGAPVRLRLRNAGTLSGRILRVGADWLLLAEDSGREALVPLAGVTGVRGLNRYAVGEPAADPVLLRLGLRPALRGIARDRSAVRIELADGSALDATIDRVGADYVEVASHAPAEARRRSEVRDVELVPLGAVVAVRRAV